MAELRHCSESAATVIKIAYHFNEMIDKTNSWLNTIIVTSVDDTEIQQDFDRYRKAEMREYVGKMCSRLMTLYVDIIPQDYKSNKMHMEAKKGAYDIERAKEVLSRKSALKI